MLRDMKLHNLRNSVAKRLVSDASVSSKYIRREPVTCMVCGKRYTQEGRTHTWEKPYHWPTHISYARFLCKKNVRAALTLNFDVK